MCAYVNVNLFMLEYISWYKVDQSDRTHPALLLLTSRSTTINYMETEQDCVIVVPNISLNYWVTV